jgi:hypothetical protein
MYRLNLGLVVNGMNGSSDRFNMLKAVRVDMHLKPKGLLY